MLPIFFLLLLAPSPAFAHKIHVFALANGDAIEGEVYAAGGVPIRNAAVDVLGPNGEKLGQTKTGEDGKFRFQARRRVDHRFVVEAGEGHTAAYTVPADELPSGLPAGASAEETPKPKATEAPAEQVAEAKPPAQAPRAGGELAELHKELEAIHTQVLQLRKQLDAYEQKVRLHDILGGIGTILGLMGLSFYYLGMKHRKERKKANDHSTD